MKFVFVSVLCLVLVASWTQASPVSDSEAGLLERLKEWLKPEDVENGASAKRYSRRLRNEQEKRVEQNAMFKKEVEADQSSALVNLLQRWFSSAAAHEEGVGSGSGTARNARKRLNKRVYTKDSSKRVALERRGSYCFEDDDCVFPFYYNGVEHNSCTMADTDYYWCSHDTNYTDSSDYSSCGCLGCDPDYNCVFPFTYKGVTYMECTDADHDEQWCSHTATFTEGSAAWSTCTCQNCMSPPECVFPFTYDDQEYTECTDADTPGEYWCSKASTYSYWSGHSDCKCYGESFKK